MKRSAIFIVLATIALASPSVLLSQTFGRDLGPADQYYHPKNKFLVSVPQKKGKGQIRWTTAPGGKQEFVKDDYVILEGDVKVYYQDIVLSADKVTYNLKTKDAYAEGHVILDQGPKRMSADRAVYNLDSERGTLFNANAHFDPDIYFAGEKIEKIDDKTYILTNGVFTSCDIDHPSWSFRMKSGIITLDDYAHLKDLAFLAQKVPLFWTPYLVWPTKADRSRGFLVPTPGYSSKYGGFIKDAYFIPYGTWADATIRGEFFTGGDVAIGTDVRYRPSATTKGDLIADVVRDMLTNKVQWRYQYQHTQDNLPGGFRGVIDVRDFSDLDFFQSFERDFNLNTISNIYSSAYLTKNTSIYSLNITTDRRENFLGPGDSLIFEQLPTLQFRTYPNEIGRTPLYFSLESSLSHLRTSLGADYYRGDVAPTLSLQLKTAPWFSIKPQVTVRDTYYTESQDPATLKIADDSLNRKYAQAQVDVVGPSFSRIFNMDIGGFSKFKHVVEPRVTYIYTTNVADQNQVINFDTVDTPNFPLVRNLVEYSLTQRIIGKEKPHKKPATPPGTPSTGGVTTPTPGESVMAGVAPTAGSIIASANSTPSAPVAALTPATAGTTPAPETATPAPAPTPPAAATTPAAGASTAAAPPASGTQPPGAPAATPAPATTTVAALPSSGASDATSARDIMSLTIKQSVSLSGPFNQTSSLVTGGTPGNDQRFTPMTVSAHVNPYQSITIDASANFGNVSHQLDSTSLSANLIGSASHSYLNLTWFSNYRQPGLDTGEASQIRVQTGLPFWKGKFRADSDVSFDADTGKFLEQRFILGMFAACYSVAFEYRDYLQLEGTSAPIRNKDYQISVSLKNIGTFIDLRGSLNGF